MPRSDWLTLGNFYPYRVTIFSAYWDWQVYNVFDKCYQGFWNFARSRSREIQVYPRNPAKLTKTREIPRNSLEILPNTCRYNIFETYLGYWSCLLAVNLQIYLEISSLPRVNIVPKLPGVLRLMLRKHGDWPQCKKLCHWCISGAYCCWNSKWWSLLRKTSCSDK